MKQVKGATVQVPEESRGRLRFDRPPVVEVVLGVQFEPLQNLRLHHVGELYRLYKDEFPKYEEQPPLESVNESFSLKEPGGLRIEWASMPPLPRVWFVKAGGNEVVQIQRDRFLHNWRKLDSGEEYPSFEVCRDLFRSSLAKFLSFIEEHQCGPWEPNQCELTYINHVQPQDLWSSHSQIGTVVRAWRDLDDPAPENVTLAMQYVIPNANGDPVGRVHVAAKPKWRLPKHSPLLELALTARGQPANPSLEGVLEFLDLAHVWERKVFLSVTTDTIQKAWGMKWTS